MRKTLVALGTSVILSAALTGCAKSEENISESASESISVSENNIDDSAGVSENNSEVQETDIDTSNNDTLSTEDALNLLSVNLLSHSVLDIDAGNIEGETSDYPLTNSEDKATLITVMITDDSEILSQYAVDAVLVNADNEEYSPTEDAAKDTTWSLTDINGNTVYLYIFRVPGEFDIDDFYLRLTTDDAELVKVLDTSHMGDFSSIENTVVIEGRTYWYTYATLGADISIKEETEIASYNEQILLTPLEGSLAVSIDNESIRLVFSEGNSTMSTENCWFEATVDEGTLSFTAYTEYSSSLTEVEKEDARTTLKDFLSDSLVGFGLDSGTGEESVIPSEYLSSMGYGTESETAEHETETETEVETETEIETETETEKTTTANETTAESITASVRGTHYVGDRLTGNDLSVTVTMSDGTTLNNPIGWSADVMLLEDTETTITITYEDVSTTVVVYAEEE